MADTSFTGLPLEADEAEASETAESATASAEANPVKLPPAAPAKLPRPKRRAATRRTAPAPATEIKSEAKASSPRLRRPKAAVSPRARRTAPAPARSLADSLSRIYQDADGKIPNMREFKIHRGSLWRRAIGTLLGALVVVALGAAAYLFISARLAPPTDPLELTITGPAEVALGAPSTYRVRLKNRSRASLANITLELNYPKGFLVSEALPAAANPAQTEWSLGSLPGNDETEVAVTGRPYGLIGIAESWRAFATFRPESLASDVRAVATLPATITESPLELSVSGPESARLGAPAEYLLTLPGVMPALPGSLELVPNFPNSFALATATPALKRGRWIILSPTATSTAATTSPRRFKLTGSWRPEASGVGAVGGTLLLTLPNQTSLTLQQQSVTTTLLENALSLSLAINGALERLTAAPGDLLLSTLRLKNNSAETLRQVTVSLVWDAPALKRQSMLNWAELTDANNATVRGEQRGDKRRLGYLTWTPAEVKGFGKLAPGAEVTLDLRLPIKNAEQFEASAIAVPTITALPGVRYLDAAGKEVDFSGTPLTITLGSDLKLESRDEVTSDEAAGSESHAITWVLTNSFHPLKNVLLTATAYGEVSFASATPTPAGRVTFDPTSKTITWSIPELPENLDTVALPFTLTLKNKNPTQTTLLSKVRVQAEDAVTDTSIEFLGEEILLAPPEEADQSPSEE
ncbi:MAG: hypothetical protein HYV42_03695 [Candidatus Magasanikbacteria bacterium]|nr:hypothetical protein [Candidatus Magasanikbacteria bacterium]